MIGLLDVLREVVLKFEKAGIEYFMVGSMATMYYGQPRFTRDLDLVARLRARQVLGFEKLFPLSEFYCPPIELIQDEVQRKGSFNLIHQESGIKVDLVIDKETEFYISEFARRKKVKISEDLQVYLASPEDLIIKKLDFYREGESEKHLSDIRDILMNVAVDEEYLQHWIKKMGLVNEWNKVQ
ncbi:MAG: hypothetical protein J0M15_11160 [Deltaproteobacteria bacterium]|jgi:hypothetical protein|nr:hypothetical protein [Deltaproteobacteria bacterium]